MPPGGKPKVKIAHLNYFIYRSQFFKCEALVHGVCVHACMVCLCMNSVCICMVCIMYMHTCMVYLCTDILYLDNLRLLLYIYIILIISKVLVA